MQVSVTKRKRFMKSARGKITAYAWRKFINLFTRVVKGVAKVSWPVWGGKARLKSLKHA